MKTLVIHPHGAWRSDRHPLDDLAEAVALAHALHFEVSGHCVNVRQLHAASFFGKGNCDAIREWVSGSGYELVIINHQLSAVQHRQLEKAWQVKVWDRHMLILEIFGARARTREGTIQVELAALRYQRSRLVRSWTHLERQRGGGGFMGGPGERQIESDRRIIDRKIHQLQKKLKTVTRTRRLQRKGRRHYPSISLVGYTNAGKTTLFNRLTHGDGWAANQLFATLDPMARSLYLPCGQTVIVSDTVGFISDLPHHLIAAFRATLEEVIDADVIIHLIDASSPHHAAQARDVSDVLAQLGVEDERPIIEAFNKADLLSDTSRDERLLLSAANGLGLNDLLGELSRVVHQLPRFCRRASSAELSHAPPPIC